MDKNHKKFGILITVMIFVFVIIFHRVNFDNIRFQKKLERVKNNSIDAKGTEFSMSTKPSPIENRTTTRKEPTQKQQIRIMKWNNFTWSYLNDSFCKVKTGFHLGFVQYKKRKRKIPLYVYPPDDDIHISRVILNGGSWEKDLLEKMVNAMNENSGSYFIDIGAHVGVYAVVIGSLGLKTIAIDPYGPNVERMCCSARALTLFDNFHIINNAVLETYKRVFIKHTSVNNIGGTRVVETTNATHVRNDSVFAIPLDELLRRFEIKSAILKIDVEGNEHKVFDGAKDFFRVVDVKYVLMEFHFHENKDSGQFILDFMTQHNFTAILPNGMSFEIYAPLPWDILWVKK